MELSVVIVNYNVRYFIEQCLLSLRKAESDISLEIIVVDNASTDGSCQMIRQNFPEITLIENTKNVGFSKANNQAIKQAKGQYILLLNPDTVVPEDTLPKCLNFMNQHSEVGGLTVKMIDGRGSYLPESKRGFPSPWTAFYKIFGLTSLFPHSKIFGQYYLGHLNPNEQHEIEILPGAFMFLRKSALDKVGLLDEQFFMYGEDIDLSYRIIEAGYKNYYYPECKIIHYKGESTKKGSLNYVIVFYQAMIIFARKHFNNKKAKAFSFLINIAIYFRAMLSMLHRVAKKTWLPLTDAALIFAGSAISIKWWEFYRFGSNNVYPENYIKILIPIYIVLWLISLWITGAYDKPQKKLATLKGTLIGTVAILSIYSILPVEMRFSRAIIFILTGWTFISTLLVRALLNTLKISEIFEANISKRVGIIGSPAEAQKVTEILHTAGIGNQPSILNSNEIRDEESKSISLERLSDFIRLNEINEVIFCSEQLSMQEILQCMLFLSPTGIKFKIAPYQGNSIIGSNSIETQGELYSLDIQTIGKPNAKRYKRLFDIVSAAVIIPLWPLTAWFARQPFYILGNAFLVLIGCKTWIGYNKSENGIGNLPKIKNNVFNISSEKNSNSHLIIEANQLYARNYNVYTDTKTLLSNLFSKMIKSK